MSPLKELKERPSAVIHLTCRGRREPFTFTEFVQRRLDSFTARMLYEQGRSAVAPLAHSSGFDE